MNTLVRPQCTGAGVASAGWLGVAAARVKAGRVWRMSWSRWGGGASLACGGHSKGWETGSINAVSSTHSCGPEKLVLVSPALHRLLVCSCLYSSTSFFRGETRGSPSIVLQASGILSRLEVLLRLCPGLACGLHSCGSPGAGWQRVLGAWTPTWNPRLSSWHLFRAPNMLRTKQGSWATPSALKPQIPGLWRPAGPPVSRGCSCRRRIYLRVLTTFSCPVPLGRQRLPKKTP